MNIRLNLAAATVAAIVMPAFGQQSEDAKATLAEATKAMKQFQSVSFDAKRYGTGMLKDFIDCEGKVMMWRPAGAKAPTLMVTGRIKQPGAGDKNLTYKNDGAQAVWLDQKENKQMERSVSDSAAIQEFGLAKQLVPEDYFAAEPFMQVLKMDKLTKLPTDNINGEACDIIQGQTADGSRTITWAIAASDHLPRRMEMATGTGKDTLSMILEMKNFDTTKQFTAKDFEIATPVGYIVEKAPAPSTAPAMPGAVPAAEIGLAAGTPAPSFNLKDADGKDFSLEGMKGNAVVLEFFGTMFKASSIGSIDMQTLSSADFKGKNVKFAGLACREPGEAAPKDYWKNHGLSYVLCPKADTVVNDYKVKGFPSYVVIAPNGKVSAFYQTWPGKDVMASAISQALATE